MSEEKGQTDRLHPVMIDGYAGTIQDLARAIMRLRYDAVRAFFVACAEELSRQAMADQARGRKVLAGMLHEAVIGVDLVGNKFQSIFNFCRPFLKRELAEHPEQ